MTPQDDSYASHTYGGMWSTFGGLLGAPADSVGSVAVREVEIPAAGSFRVWSRYQAPPYYSYEHRIDVFQGGKRVFTHDYGKVTAKRLWSFGGAYQLSPMAQIWWPWGVDHDCAEAPSELVALAQGKAELRLTTLKSAAPAGDRYVDFVLLTTDARDTCDGFQKHGQAKSPFMFEGLDATPIYMRFQNRAPQPAKVELNSNFGHHTWHCAPAKGTFPELPVAPGQWSPWFNINHVARLVTDEGLRVTVAGSEAIPVEFALEPNGGRGLGQLTVPNGETVHLPMEMTWDATRRPRLSRDIAAELVRQTKTWRRAAPHKPRYIAFFGAFDRGNVPWAMALKDALGYNTQLPDRYEHLEVDGYYQHVGSVEAIRKHAAGLGARRSRQLVASFGDEIRIGHINFADPENMGRFRAWLSEQHLAATDLGGVAPEQATFDGNARLAWYAALFSARQRFADYRKMTRAAEEAYGPQVLTGANYSPHHGVAYYGSNLQWVDAFKYQAMSMFWSEDYIFSMAEPPQIFSFLLARAHCAVKYHHQPIHMYVMPHAPGQQAGNFRRNLVYAVGAGVRHIDDFWVAPQEQQSLYLALRHAQYRVDLITEDDIVEDGALDQYAAVYFAGEWINDQAVPRIAAWVRQGGVFYACAGLGHRNQFNEPFPACLELLGVREAATRKTLCRVRPLLELPLAEPAGKISLADGSIDAVGMKQTLTPDGATVLGRWEDGAAAATVMAVGRGKAFAVGTLPGLSYLKTGLHPAPPARGGNHVYHPTDFSRAAAALVRLGVDAAGLEPSVRCDHPQVEALVRDNAKGTLLALVNWTDEPELQVTVTLPLPFTPKRVFSISRQTALETAFQDGVLWLTTSLREADFVTVYR